MRYIDLAINLTFIGVCLIVGIRAGEPSAARRAPIPTYQLGETVAIPGLPAHTRTLLIVDGWQKEHLEVLLPLLRELIAAKATSRPSIVIASVDAERMKQVLATAGVQVDEVIPVQLRTTKITDIPTVLLLNQDGRVKRLWRGKQFKTGFADIVHECERAS